MDKIKLMIKYSNGQILSNEELDYLEDCFDMLINEARLTDALPPKANDSICDLLGLQPDSFEMNCIARILDKVMPIENGMCREQQVFHVILQSKFLYY